MEATSQQTLDVSAIPVDVDTKPVTSEEIALVPRVNAATIARLDNAIQTLETQAEAFTCATPADYALGDAAVGRIRQLEKLFTDVVYGPTKAYYNDKLKEVRAEEAQRLPVLERVKRAIAAKMLAWKAEEDKRVADARRAAEEEARKAAEEVRLQQAVKVEERAKATGDTELAGVADKLLDQPLDIAPVQVQSAVPIGGHTKVRMIDDVRVTDLGQALVAIGATLLTSDSRCTDELRKALESFCCKSSRDILDSPKAAKNLTAALETWARDEYKVRGEKFVVPGIFTGKKQSLG